jgi:hypothetical protein
MPKSTQPTTAAGLSFLVASYHTRWPIDSAPLAVIW